MGYRHRPSKWASLMLPEHREHLERLHMEQEGVAPPQLDEQQREAIDQGLTAALRAQALVAVRYYRDRRLHMAQGWVVGCDQSGLTLRDKTGRSLRLRLGELTDLRVCR